MAALHFNENFGRDQAKTASGSERIRIVFPKQKKGEFTPKPVPVPKTYRMFIFIITINTEFAFTHCVPPLICLF